MLGPVVAGSELHLPRSRKWTMRTARWQSGACFVIGSVTRFRPIGGRGRIVRRNTSPPEVMARKRSRLRCGLPDPAHAPRIVAHPSMRVPRALRIFRSRPPAFETHADRPRNPFFSLRARRGPWRSASGSSGCARDARPYVHTNPLSIHHNKGARHDPAASRLRPQGRFRWFGPPARKG